ncbi:MAG: DUF3604 domain-containing protein [Gammaproteobacteria bacterium]|jgi:hypothetical protein|nr:DUF3604 domain-containing protein [Gammaproteobacteria bacterium]MBT4379707.1 DUF3604 domain-containing protein [Gammaproteobacteria bacterium]MBT6665070.1 DUF3604 domain-containing protein [Gammaproteobacteria bacterium]MBT7174179.1 DUF3604 domain-containing protein [Gammaproteobacteria bacterium]MBT7531985.1 DUF3604 domain-containing protein [Gammaproteobacteria bacterium]
MRLPALVMVLFLLGGCQEASESNSSLTAHDSDKPILAVPTSAGPRGEKHALFGDLHVHTMYSFDAFVMGTLASPDAAYDFAKGGVLTHPGGFDMQLDVPLDFYAVTDHAFYLGALRSMTVEGNALYEHELAEGVRNLSDEKSRGAAFATMLAFLLSERRAELIDPVSSTSAWDDIKAAANRHNDPGKFTAFLGYEYTSSGDAFENLHRNVIFKGDTAPDLPFSRLDSRNPEELWRWMDEQRLAGYESLAMPHNSNGSNGWMFSLTDFDGKPLDSDYADLRMRNERLVENSQIKGTSDTHPALSPNDEWADFEIMKVRIASNLASQPQGSYVREALRNGIEFQAKKGFNPFKFGVIGSSDTHNASYAGAEDNYWSKTGRLDDEPVERGSVPLAQPAEDGSAYLKTYRNQWSAGSLAGVWAEENTRTAIYDALHRKETFSTSGTRLQVRFFAGYDLPAPDANDLINKAYAGGVPMGGELVAEAGQSPSFLVWALQDPNKSALQRVQIIKASVRDGNSSEKVFDVACSDGAKVNPQTHRCPDNGARVDLTNCTVSTGVGDPEMLVRWVDPEFDESEHAIYYVRALENPVCRWSTWDALRTGVEPNPALSATIQERAWTSPIWFSPASE